MKLNFTSEEAKLIFRNSKSKEMVGLIGKMIECLRHTEKESRSSIKTVVGGLDLLYQMVTQGTIDLLMYLKITKLIENPEMEYEINIV